MTYPKYLELVGECKKCTTASAFAAEYGYPDDCEWTAGGLINAVDIIYAVSRNDFAALVEGKNLSAFCRAYNIPLRSAQNWQNGARKAPGYVVQMIGFALIAECERENNE